MLNYQNYSKFSLVSVNNIMYDVQYSRHMYNVFKKQNPDRLKL